MKALAPGKIILSGEHAVVYGRPALVLAVDRFAEATVEATAERKIALELLDYGRRVALPFPELAAWRNTLEARYERFLRGDLPIRQVLQQPEELLLYAASLLLEELPGPSPGAKIRVNASIPRGRGMGSSAATVVAVLRALAGFWGIDLSVERLHRKAHQAESLQHGRSSGVDPYISAHGGLVRFAAGKGRPLSLPRRFHFWLVDTGLPESTTGEAVAHVASWIGEGPIWHDFESTTLAVEEALLRSDETALRHWIRANQRLLEEIGVVPARVRAFVAEVERRGGAAKVCGAGAVHGEAAGMLLVLWDEPVEQLCERFGYRLLAVAPEEQGVRLG